MVGDRGAVGDVVVDRLGHLGQLFVELVGLIERDPARQHGVDLDRHQRCVGRGDGVEELVFGLGGEGAAQHLVHAVAVRVLVGGEGGRPVEEVGAADGDRGADAIADGQLVGQRGEQPVRVPLPHRRLGHHRHRRRVRGPLVRRGR